MRAQSSRWLCVVMLALVMSGSAMAAGADESGSAAHDGSHAQSCHDFAWDVHRERRLLAGPPHDVKGGTSAAATPRVLPDELYEVQLAPQSQVQYVTPPGKVMLSDGAYGGMVKFTVPRTGSYRVALDAPFWIDVVAGGKLLATEDFSGQRGCANPRKIVIFQMPAGEPLTLQISGARSAQAEFTLTAAPQGQSAPGQRHEAH